MNIIAATTAAPLRPQAMAAGVEDVVAEAWSVYGEVQTLAGLGIEVEVSVSRQGRIAVEVTASREAVELLPALVEQLERSTVTYTPTGVRAIGTMCRGHVDVAVTVDRADLTTAELEQLVAATDAVRGSKAGRAA
ncbi:hypothetical protein [Streptomyces sp. NPDC101393]|uniref:hypothetical protein n=1 Tax=Streptomyces sp. NPDC101393 TaxID=3366141 RepID=UPI00381A1937